VLVAALLAVPMMNTVLAQTIRPAPSAGALAGGPSDAHEVEGFMDSLVPAQLREQHIAGAAVAVVRDGRLLFSKGYGFADLASQRPALADLTLFRTDSTGKLLVWTAVMQLVEQGKLDLDADVNRYIDFQIPDTFPQPVTLRHLLSHTAGFDAKPYLLAHELGDVEPIGAWLARNLPARVRPPGIVSGYSNYGTGLAAYIVARASGVPFEQYAEERIFAPLSMRRSTFRQPPPDELAADLSATYRYADGAFRRVPFQYLRAQVGEGAMTATDMARFMIAHLSPNDSPILKAATARQMHGRLLANDPRVSGFAYGFAETTQNGQRILRHEGNLEGVSSSALFLLPEQRLGVYIVYNSNGGFGPGEEFRRAFLDRYFPAAATPPAPAQLTPQQAAALTGSYRSTTSFARSFAKVLTLLGGLYADVTVRANADGTFTTGGIGPRPLRWVAVEPRVLRLADGALNAYGDLVFAADEQGRVTRLFVANNPYRAYEKTAWYEAAGLQGGLLALYALLFLSLLVVVPGAALAARIATSLGVAAPTRAQWILAGAALLALLFLGGLALTLEESLLYGVTPALMAVLAIPFAALALAAASLFFAGSGWGTMGLLARGHYVAGVAAMAGFAGWLYFWNLLGFHF
jgi:CubicO group peptidase (beta-lactamase class C family)